MVRSYCEVYSCHFAGQFNRELFTLGCCKKINFEGIKKGKILVVDKDLGVAVGGIFSDVWGDNLVDDKRQILSADFNQEKSAFLNSFFKGFSEGRVLIMNAVQEHDSFHFE